MILCKDTFVAWMYKFFSILLIHFYVGHFSILFVKSINRKKVTRADFDKFKSGHIESKYELYEVHESAHPENFFGQMANFSNHPIDIVFIDKHHNNVQLYYEDKEVIAILIYAGMGAGPFADIPSNYHKYTFNVREISAADIDAIDRWLSAKEVKIRIQGDNPQFPKLELMMRLKCNMEIVDGEVIFFISCGKASRLLTISASAIKQLTFESVFPNFCLELISLVKRFLNSIKTGPVQNSKKIRFYCYFFKKTFLDL